MNFIEQIFRVSPDNGTGVLEATILFVVLVVPIVCAVLRMRRPRLR
jgi:ABC-type phosphate transport system permease subunit